MTSSVFIRWPWRPLLSRRGHRRTRGGLSKTREFGIRRQPFCSCELCRLDYGRLAYPRTLTRDKAITV